MSGRVGEAYLSCAPCAACGKEGEQIWLAASTMLCYFCREAMNTDQLTAHVAFFSDASSVEAREFCSESDSDRAFIVATLADINERIAAFRDPPHALRVLAHQARILWEGKLT